MNKYLKTIESRKAGEEKTDMAEAEFHRAVREAAEEIKKDPRFLLELDRVLRRG